MPPDKTPEPGTADQAADENADAEVASQRFANRFTRQYYEFKNAVCQAQVEVARKQQEINARFADTWQQAQKEAFKPAQEAYFEYLKVFQRSRITPDQAGIADVYRAQSNYLEAHERAQERARKAFEDARKTFAAEMEQIQKEAAAVQRAAYEDYVKAIKASWSEIDPASIDAKTLAATAQSMSALAACVMYGGQTACMP